MRILAACFVLLFALMSAKQASAVIASISTSPVSRTVTMGGSSTFTMTWRITRAAGGAPFTVQSRQGEFRRNGNTPVPWVTTRSLSRTFTQNTLTVNITETVTVPQAVMRKALEDNNGVFIYYREFTDDGFATTTAQDIDLQVTGGMAGPLDVAAVTLMFDDGTTFRTVAQDAAMTAKARVSIKGSGQFHAVWEIGDTAGGSSFYRPLQPVTKTLSGKSALLLESPALPTQNTGRYNVRLRVTEPDNIIDIPVLSYFVTAGDNAGHGDIPAMATVSPKPDASVGKDTPFEWQEVKGAAAYRLQILENSAALKLVAAMMVKGHAATLSPFVIGQLQSPAAYRWRVIALDGEGRVIAASTSQLIRTKSR